jgi:hypothetical protein
LKKRDKGGFQFEFSRCHSLEFLNSQQKFVVIPAKLAIPPEADEPQAEASASRNPDVVAGLKPAPTRFPLSR